MVCRDEGALSGTRAVEGWPLMGGGQRKGQMLGGCEVGRWEDKEMASAFSAKSIVTLSAESESWGGVGWFR